jgi:hypothetical protein
MDMDFLWLKDNLEIIESEIAAACERVGRPSSDVALMAVSKAHPAHLIVAAALLGLSVFGESRVQEFKEKCSNISAMGYSLPQSGGRHATDGELKPLSAQFHFIGHLQSNKSTRAAELFSSVDTVDSLHLAERLNDAALNLHRRLPVLIEIKLSTEASKMGFAPGSYELDQLLERLPALTALDARGWMTIPRYDADPEASRTYFARLRSLRDEISVSHPHLQMRELSMGMSHDFAVAIEEGSTQVRIGTKLFGSRPPVAVVASD